MGSVSDLVRISHAGALGGESTTLELSGRHVVFDAAAGEKAISLSLAELRVTEGKTSYLGGTLLDNSMSSNNSRVSVKADMITGGGVLSNAWGGLRGDKYTHTLAGDLSSFTGLIVAGDLQSKGVVSGDTASAWRIEGSAGKLSRMALADGATMDGSVISGGFAGDGTITLAHANNDYGVTIYGRLGDKEHGAGTSLENATTGKSGELILANGVQEDADATAHGALIFNGNTIRIGRSGIVGGETVSGTWGGNDLRNNSREQAKLILTSGLLQRALDPAATQKSNISVTVEATGVMNVGGTDGSIFDDVVVSGGHGGRLTNVSGSIVAGNKEQGGIRVSLTFGQDNIGSAAGEAGDYLISSNGGTLEVAEFATADMEGGLELDFTNRAFMDTLLRHREENYKSYLHVLFGGELTGVNGKDVTYLFSEGEADTPANNWGLLQDIGFNIAAQHDGGDLVMAGTSKDVYLVLNPYEYAPGLIDDPDAATRAHRVDEFGILSGFKATVVDEDTTLTVTVGDLPTESDDVHVKQDIVNGGLTVNNLVGLRGSVFHATQAADATGDVTVVLNNAKVDTDLDMVAVDHAGQLGEDDLKGQNTRFEGTIVGDAGVNFDKIGRGTLTVGDETSQTGGLQLQGDFTLRNGGLTVQGDDASFVDDFIFAYNDGATEGGLEVTNDATLTVNGSLKEEDRGGDIRLTKEGELILKGRSELHDTTISSEDGTGSLTVTEGGSLSMDASGMEEDRKGVIDGVDVELAGGDLTVSGGGRVSDSNIDVTEGGSFGLASGSTMSDGNLSVSADSSATVDGKGSGITGSGDITVDGQLTVSGGGSIELDEEGDITINGPKGSLTVKDGSAGSHVATEGSIELGEGGTLDIGQSKGNRAGHFNGSGTLAGGSDSEFSITGSGNTFTGTLEGSRTDTANNRKSGGGTLIIEDGADLKLDGITTNSEYVWQADVKNNGTLTVDVSKNESDVDLDITLRQGSNFNYTFDTDRDARLNGNLTVTGPVGSVVISSDGTAPTDTDVDLGNIDFTGNLDDLKSGLTLAGNAFSHYDVDDLVVEDGKLKLKLAKVVENRFMRAGMEKNARAGATLLWDASDPGTSGATYIGTHQEGDLSRILSIITWNASDKTKDISSTLAAVAGASTSVLGSAMSQDIERQLNTIRNRTTMMSDASVNADPGEPTFHMWINAESGYNKLDADSLAPGFTLNGWGGTVGVDTELRNNVHVGLALTAMYNDLKTDSADNGRGDMDATYLSAFARTSRGAWTHTFIATAGLMDVSLNRTVASSCLVYGFLPDAHSYTAKGSTDGYALGAMYEVGYTYLMNEQGTFAVQPVANIQFRHATINGYTESGTDAGLKVGDITHDVITLGVGARVQGIIGENAFNRASVFEARALVKTDFGDRPGTATNALIHGSGASAEVESASVGSVGLEIGAGLSVPVGSRGGSVFIDGSVEFRSNYTSTNASAGYRISF